MSIEEKAKNLFDIQIKELEKIKNKIGNEIEKLCNLILETKGKVVITGVGKSGLIGKKIASTLASTGTSSIFMNSAEGLHGDLGMINPEDIVLAISNSGSSDEIINLIPSIKKIGAKLVTFTGNKKSRLAMESDLIIDIGVEKEACPMNLAPTCSTTATLVMGDTIASILIELRDFKPENFAVYHPGGALGRRLLTKVKDIMKTNIGIISQNAMMDEIINVMTEKSLGAVCIVEEEKMLGIITEGDIRRALKNKERFFFLMANDIMTKEFIYISSNIQAIEALDIMENGNKEITVLPVIDDSQLKGLIRIHDLLKPHIVKLIATFLPNELQMVSSSLSTFLALN